MRKLILLLLIVLVIILFACGSRKNCECNPIELHEDGSQKLVFCKELSKRGGMYKEYDKHGHLILEFHLDSKGQIHGELTKYSTNGVIITRCNYSNGQKHGECIFYDEQGVTDTYNLYWNDTPVYVKDFTSNGSTGEEGFLSIISLDNISDTEQVVDLKVSLPLPDSLFENKEFYFVAGVSEDKLENPPIGEGIKVRIKSENQIITVPIKLLLSRDQFLYNYLIDEKKKQIFMGEDIQIFYEDKVGYYTSKPEKQMVPLEI